MSALYTIGYVCGLMGGTGAAVIATLLTGDTMPWYAAIPLLMAGSLGAGIAVHLLYRESRARDHV